MPKSDDEALLAEIRSQFDYATSAWADIRAEGAIDVRYVSGDPWSANDKASRKLLGRPMLVYDELGQYVNQLINEVRANKRAIRVSPEGEGADDKTAQFRQSLIRQIEYRSHAQDAYTVAFENAVQRSYGYLRVKAQHVSDDSFDQELVIEPIPNPDLVTMDPDAMRPDGSDAAFCFVREARKIEDFKREWPKAEITDFAAFEAETPNWIKGETIYVAEYWKKERKKRTKLLLAPPDGIQDQPISVWEDELPKGAKPPKDRILKSRTVLTSSVKQYITNGVEILERNEWPGKYLPIVACYGKVLFVSDSGGTSRQILSMVRLARDPAMMVNYYASTEAEVVGMTPKTPYVGYRGQFAGMETDWQKVSKEPLAYLEANATTDDTGSQVLPLPQRQPYEPAIQALEVGKESARRAVQSSIGSSPLPTSAQRRNEKSGVALKQIESAQQKGSFHFLDHYDSMVSHTGRILDDLIPHYYDTMRDIGIRKADDTPEVVRINDPQNDQSPRADIGQHEVTISTGPSFDSEREAASDFADTLANIPAVFAQIADLVIKLKNLGPIGDEIAERLTPPQYRKKEQGAIDPQEVAAMQGQMQQMQQVAGQMKQALETEQAKQQATIKKAEIDRDKEIELQRMRDATSIAVAKINAIAKGVIVDQEAENEAVALAAEHAHQLHVSQMGAQQAQAQAEQAHAQGEQSSQADYQRQLEAGDIEHQRALEHQAQAQQAAPTQE
jgi:hypothetical protein